MSQLPAPTPNDRPAIWDMVIADMQARHELGKQRYGTALQAFNGRISEQDEYEEMLDFIAYKRKSMEEMRELTTLLNEVLHFLGDLGSCQIGHPYATILYNELYTFLEDSGRLQQ